MFGIFDSKKTKVIKGILNGSITPFTDEQHTLIETIKNQYSTCIEYVDPSETIDEWARNYGSDSVEKSIIKQLKTHF